MATLPRSHQYAHYALDLTASQHCIRLLDLLPDQRDGTIRCAMLPEKQVSLTGEARLSYTAISYECGDSRSTRHTILMNGKRFSVLRNLHTMLVSLQERYPSGHSRLWIDAVSIDQDNLIEKNHQVQLLKAIYTKAHHVLCWLGPADNESDKVFDLLNEVNVSLQYECSAADSLRSVPRADWTNVHDALRNGGSKIKFSFVALTERGYWSKSIHDIGVDTEGLRRVQQR